MILLSRVRAWRAAKKADRQAIARARAEGRRAGDEPPETITETVENVSGTYPPPS